MVYIEAIDMAEADANAEDRPIVAAQQDGGLQKLADEYRKSMDPEILHSWAADVVDAIRSSEAENARLRALPLKDEVERVLEPFAAEANEWVDDVPDGYHPGATEPGHDQAHASAKFSLGHLRAARAILSRLRAGETGGKTPGAEEAFAALDVADRLIERAYGTQTPQEWHDEYHNVAKARSLSEGGSRNG